MIKVFNIEMRMYYEVTKQAYAINMQIIFDIIDLRSLESVGDVS